MPLGDAMFIPVDGITIIKGLPVGALPLDVPRGLPHQGYKHYLGKTGRTPCYATPGGCTNAEAGYPRQA